MKNIHVLPTDKSSRFTFRKDYEYYRFRKDEFVNNDTYQNQNIYITNDDEIKEGDWFLNIKSGAIGQHNGAEILLFKDDRKIILTTDQDLIKDGVQAIDDEFLEWFVNNSSCDSVKIDLVPVNEFGSEITVGGYGFDKFKYKIIIPTEEPNPLTVGKEFYESADKNITVYRQETLEEVANHYAEGFEYNQPSEHGLFVNSFQGFISGAKWQQEQDKNKYSEEEVLVKLYECLGHFAYQHNIVINGNEIDKWFEKFKKK
jgi:hypothetical protein